MFTFVFLYRLPHACSSPLFIRLPHSCVIIHEPSCSRHLPRYVYLYEKITGEEFKVPSIDEPVNERMKRNLRAAGL